MHTRTYSPTHANIHTDIDTDTPETPK